MQTRDFTYINIRFVKKLTIASKIEAFAYRKFY